MARYIDVDEFISEQCGKCDGYCECVNCDCLNCKSDNRCGFIQELSDFQLADVKPIVRREWLHRWDESIVWLECSNCGFGSDGEVRMDEDTPFCPMCGCDMRKEKTK